MSFQYPALIIIIPVLAAVFCSALMWGNRRLVYPLCVLALTVTALSTFVLLAEVIQFGPVDYRMAGWPPPWGIQMRIDLLNGLVLCIVSVIALVNLIASFRSVEQELAEKTDTFYILYLLFVTGLLGVVITGDLFNLYVLLEVTSLAAYAQIAMGDPDRSPVASLNYVFLGVIGASFYLLGVGYLYIKTGSLNMMDIASILPSLYSSLAVFTAFVFCMVGVWAKMALFPLHVWLPNAYAYAPTASNRIMAPLMTKVMVYVMIRLMFSVFGMDYVFEELALSEHIVLLASIAILAGAVLALAQKDLKKMLTYIIVSEIGYLVGGAWLGNSAALTGTVLHVLNDALMTFCLFLAVGNMSYKLKNLHFDNLQGLFSRMPLTMAGFVLAGVSIVGIPPTCGFFSKWFLLSGALEAGNYVFLLALVFSSLINAVLFFRIFEICFFEPMKEDHAHDHSRTVFSEAPASMLVPLLLVAAGLLAVGLYSGIIVDHLVAPFVSGVVA